MFDTICTYPLPSDLFAQSLHPSTPLIAVGLASGHVHALRLPSTSSSSSDHSSTSSGDGANGHSTPSDGRGTVQTVWQTRRHKGSCRALAFSVDGESLVSAGSEGVVKVADSEIGRVRWKVRVPDERDELNPPSLLHMLSPQTMILATDTSSLHVYDFREPASTGVSSRPQATHHPHDDYVSSLSPLPPTDASTSGYSKQWVSTGGSTLAVTDLRRGVMARSEDQEQELLSSVYITGLVKRGTSQGEKAVVGSGNGVITLWEKGAWDDQDERITVDGGKGGGESLDVLVEVPGGVNGNKGVAIGMGDGKIRFVALGKNKVMGEVSHDEVDGVVGLGFEPEGRLVSGGGSTVKVWEESWGNGGPGAGKEASKRTAESESDDSDDSNDSDDGEKGKKRRKKRKRSRGKDKTGGKAGLPAFKDLD